MEQRLWTLVDSHHLQEASDLLSNLSNPSNPSSNFNVNWRGPHGWTLLHLTCDRGMSFLVSQLLDVPGVDVNTPNGHGDSPLDLACYWGRTACVRLLLNHPLLQVKPPGTPGSPLGRFTVLFWAAGFGQIDPIKRWIADRVLTTEDLGNSGDERTDAIGEAAREGKTAVALLLNRFQSDPRLTVFQTRAELGYPQAKAATLFGLIVFTCDGLLRISAKSEKNEDGQRTFFAIACRLPLDLQMVLCNRVAGSGQSFIGGEDREGAYRLLAHQFV